MFRELELREGWVTVICLLLMGLCVAWAYQTAQWVDGMAVLQAAVLASTVLGIVLAKSRIPSWLAHPLSLLAGWTTASYLTAQVLSRATGSTQAVAVADVESLFRAMFPVLLNREGSVDNYVFLLLLSFLTWLLAYWAAWVVFRRQQVWWAIILWGTALLINNSYAEEINLTFYLILFLLASLLLLVRASLALREQEWREAHVNYSPELISGFLRTGLMISLIVVLLAWIAPAALASRPLQPFWDKVGEPWRRLQEESSRLFQDLNYRNKPPLLYLPDERRMLFGGAVELEDIPLADVEAETGRYWRVMVFHEYTSNGWVNTDPDTILIGENEQDLDAPTLDLRFNMTQTVTVLHDWAPTDALIAAAQPLRSGLPLRASVSFLTLAQQERQQATTAPELLPQSAEGTASPPAPTEAPLPMAPGDPSAIYSQHTLYAGNSYNVMSTLTEVDQESLRGAGTEYPDWVVPRYLQLPDSLPDDVRQLAEQWTEGLETPYDKAKTIEAWLREIPYNTQIEGPGLREDGVYYFLFEVREGYCQYYASAMVVMLRAVGVPTRYVHGYRETDPEGGVYHLLESDGHAWPEVYFPGYGWIEFEPTGGEPPLNRPSSQEPEAAEMEYSGTGRISDMELDLLPDDFDFERGFDIIMPTPEPETLGQKLGKWGPAALIVTGLAVILTVVLTVLRRRRIAGLSIIERVYEDLTRWVRYLLRIEPLPHQTPHEFAGIVAEWVPRGEQAVQQLASLYVQERFSGSAASGDDAERAWSEARPAIWKRWLALRLEFLRRLWRFLVPAKPSPSPEETHGYYR